jgi:formylglycine-generating enzyme required for sulfatase activity
MRSWFTAMPGENISCVGCHEKPQQTPLSTFSLAANQPPNEIEPWYGPARGFDFKREVQPVLDQYCVGCHKGDSSGKDAIADLRDESFFPHYNGRQLTTLGATRLDPTTVEFLGGTRMRYTPAYDALVPYIRRVGIEDDAHLLKPGEYHADTSPLIQMLQKGHHNVKLDDEAMDRLVTWIDLNGPCHGTWGDAAPVPNQVAKKRAELRNRYAGQDDAPEATLLVERKDIQPIMPEPLAREKADFKAPPNWPLTQQQAKHRQQKAGGPIEKTIELGSGVTLRLVKVPAGSFVMGEPDGLPDESPAVVTIQKDFWIGAFEVSNQQFQQYNPAHNSGYFSKRFASMDGPGLDLNNPDQPAVRVSWNQASDFCDWLSEKTGATFTLPTEAQWEYACRAGSATAMSYGTLDDDFSTFANLADNALKLPTSRTGGVTTSLTNPDGYLKGILLESQEGGNIPCDARFDDGAVTTTLVGQFQPNAWGLYDAHGNAAEWTSTAAANSSERRIVRGGSWVDTPYRSRSAFRLDFPAWQAVHNAGFRVVMEAENASDAPRISEE